MGHCGQINQTDSLNTGCEYLDLAKTTNTPLCLLQEPLMLTRFLYSTFKGIKRESFVRNKKLSKET